MKILIVEDDMIVRTNLSMHLREDLGYEVVEATDGLDAIEKLMPDGKLNTTIDRVVTDMRMYPGKSGLWFLQYLNHSRVKLPCLLRSTEASYREEGHEFDLQEVAEVFDFVKFRLKDDHFKDVDEFLKGLR